MEISGTAGGIACWTGPDGRTWRVTCALGRGGVGQKRAEGDGITPVGRFPLRRVFYRPDRIPNPATALAVVALEATDGWSDDPADKAYNTLVSLPHPASHERLWRHDGLYDVIIETGFNDDPVIPGKGSAIFIHIARDDFAPTEGCVALKRDDLLRVLALCAPGDRLIIAP